MDKSQGHGVLILVVPLCVLLIYCCTTVISYYVPSHSSGSFRAPQVGSFQGFKCSSCQMVPGAGDILEAPSLTCLALPWLSPWTSARYVGQNTYEQTGLPHSMAAGCQEGALQERESQILAFSDLVWEAMGLYSGCIPFSRSNPPRPVHIQGEKNQAPLHLFFLNIISYQFQVYRTVVRQSYNLPSDFPNMSRTYLAPYIGVTI